MRVFTVSTARFQRAASRNPGPRNSVKGVRTPSPVGLTPGVRNAWQADFRRTDHLTKGARGGSDTQPREPATESNTVERFVRVMSEGQEEERREDGRVVFRRSDGRTELIDALH